MQNGDDPKPDLPVQPDLPVTPDVPQDPPDPPIQDPAPGRKAPDVPHIPDVGDPMPGPDIGNDTAADDRLEERLLGLTADQIRELRRQTGA